MFKGKRKKASPYIPRKIKTSDMVSEDILVKEIAKNPYLGLRIALKGQGIDIPAAKDTLAAAKEGVIRDAIRNDAAFRNKIKRGYLSRIKLTRDVSCLDDMINRAVMERLRADQT